MKVQFKNTQCGFCGTADDMVYYYHPKLMLNLARLYVVPTASDSNIRTKLVMANLKQINPSESFKQNCRDYICRYNKLKGYQAKPLFTWSNLYLKLMFALQKDNPDIDLTTLSREQIYAQDLPCISIRRAVEAGLLPKVANYQCLDKPI